MINMAVPTKIPMASNDRYFKYVGEIVNFKGNTPAINDVKNMTVVRIANSIILENDMGGPIVLVALSLVFVCV